MGSDLTFYLREACPGHPKIHPRRNSADYGPKAIQFDVQPPAKSKDDRCLIWTPPRNQELTPPQWRVQVIYQAHDAPEKEWRGFFTEDDTEDLIEKRARRVLGIIGCWRRQAYWRDENGIRLVMTNKKKEAIFRYHTELDRTIKEMRISEDDTPATIILKLKFGSNFHLVDSEGILFAPEDNMFGYCSRIGSPPVQVLHGSALHTRKTRQVSPKKDGRIGVEVRLEDNRMEYNRNDASSYARIFADVREDWNILGQVIPERTRAEEDRIILECMQGIDAFWFSEKAWPP
jgi:hypothetical protein